MNTSFQHLLFEGSFIRVCVYDRDKDNKLPMGWALVQQTREEPVNPATQDYQAVIYHIQIREQYRKMGYASQLIKYMQGLYTKIITDYEVGILNSASCQLLFKSGFNAKAKFFKRDPCGKLVWRKNER